MSALGVQVKPCVSTKSLRKGVEFLVTLGQGNQQKGQCFLFSIVRALRVLPLPLESFYK